VRSSTVDTDRQETPGYEAPTVVDYGDLRDLTAGTNTGNYTDQVFPAGTSRGDLTFSTTP
jgi:hypothetical protein